MKKMLLGAALLATTATSVSAAGWNGFYVRTDISVMGSGHSHKKKDDAPALNLRKEGKTDRLIHFAVAGGWGKVFSGSIYAGLDATLLGLSGVMEGLDTNNFSFIYDPKLTARVGFARCNMLVYAGGGAGAMYAFSDKDKLKGFHGDFPKNASGDPELIWTWHIRVGVDFKVKGNWTAGAFYEYQRSISHKNEGDKVYPTAREDLSLINDRVAFVFGYQM